MDDAFCMETTVSAFTRHLGWPAWGRVEDNDLLVGTIGYSSYQTSSATLLT